MDTQGFRKRFEAIQDIEELLSVAAPQYRDPEVYFKELIEDEPNISIAEKRLRVLEDLRANSEEEKKDLTLDRIRRERLQILIDTDWTQLVDSPITSADKKFYRKYRQYLRDLPVYVKRGTLRDNVMTYDEWKKWIEIVRHTPGFEGFIP